MILDSLKTFAFPFGAPDGLFSGGNCFKLLEGCVEGQNCYESS